MKISKTKIILVLFILLLFLCYYIFDIQNLLTLSHLKDSQATLTKYYNENQITFSFIFFATYILITAFSIPGATILTLAGGAVFGLTKGIIIISFASSIGATLAFLTARYLLQDKVQSTFPDKFETINKGLQEEGLLYLFSLRLIPIFPFFLINLVMGLTKIKVLSFYLVSQIGMFLGTLLYVNAGVELSKIQSLNDIFSLKILISFTLIGIFPLIVKKIINKIKIQKAYSQFKRPKKYDYNMIVIGAGAGGLVTSYISAAVKAKVLLIEKDKMGGDCLYTGCVPSKTLIKSANIVHLKNQSQKYGLNSISIHFEFSNIMARIREVIKAIEPHDSKDRYTSLGVECIQGKAKILSPWEVEVDNKIYTTRNITIATGASPKIPDIEGISEIPLFTSNTIWNLDSLPDQLLIIGAGAIGLELGQAFNRLGSKVTIIESLDQILINEDREIADELEEDLTLEGITFFKKVKIQSFENNPLHAIITVDGQEKKIPFSHCLVAIGKKVNIQNLVSKNLEIEMNENGTIKTNNFMQTSYPNIFACGDVTGPFQLTHAAAHQAWYCAINGLFRGFKKFSIKYNFIPKVIYTSPEIGSIGLSSKELEKRHIPYEVYQFDMKELDRAIIDGDDKGRIKVFLKKNSDKILGATIIHPDASTLLAQFTWAMKENKGLNHLLTTIHPYPTILEANKYLAGKWRTQKRPEKILALLKKYHRFFRKS